MRTLGIAVIVFGGLLLLVATNLAVTQYNLSSSHDVSKCVSGFAFAVLTLAVGLSLFRRGGTARNRT